MFNTNSSPSSSGALPDEEIVKMSIDEGLSIWLEKHFPNKWERHFGTFESIVWKPGAVPPPKTWYIYEKDALEEQQYGKLKRRNDLMKMGEVIPDHNELFISLFEDIESGRLGENAKESEFFKKMMIIKSVV